jgi:thiamine pyrophosphokinase
MSSHHIVKEGQEPALIIANGESCSMDLITSLLEWSPFIVALDGAYSRVLELGIHPDVVIGDFDSIENTEIHPDIQFIELEDQDNTDLEKGIDFLQKRGFLEINIIWATGRRMDHTVNNIGTLARYPQLSLVMYDDLNKIYLLPRSFEKYYLQGDPISLIPIGTVSGIRSSGLKFELRGSQLDLASKTGSSNEALESGLVRIEYENGFLVLMESYDPKPD